MKHGSLTHLAAKKHGKGQYCDGRGLWLRKSSPAQGQWVQRLVVQGRRREMGLGGYPEVTIAEARERSAAARRLLRDGLDPIEERNKQRRKVERMTVAAAIDGCFKARQADLKDDGKAGGWLSPLRLWVIPAIGNTAIEDVDQHKLVKVLEPIWHEKADTARKALNRINLTLKWAAALGLDVDLQATLKTRALLGKQRHTAKPVATLPYAEAPNFYAFLSGKHTMTALALRFLMLTACRSGEVRNATRSEIEDDVWIIPAKRTKQQREHRVPLSPEALTVAKEAMAQHNHEVIFASPKGKGLSDMSLSKFMKDNGYTARPHGLRSTFRTWSEECTQFDHVTKELSLGHTVGSNVERAYQRSDLLEKRRSLLIEWASHVLNLNKCSKFRLG